MSKVVKLKACVSMCPAAKFAGIEDFAEPRTVQATLKTLNHKFSFNATVNVNVSINVGSNEIPVC